MGTDTRNERIGCQTTASAEVAYQALLNAR